MEPKGDLIRGGIEDMSSKFMFINVLGHSFCLARVTAARHCLMAASLLGYFRCNYLPFAKCPLRYGNCSRKVSAICVLVATHTPSFFEMYSTKSCNALDLPGRPTMRQ